MKKRVRSMLALVLLLTSLLIGMQIETAFAWEYDLGSSEPAANP
jgi:hypothetical protein